MKLEFTKMSGAGNDFIMVNNIDMLCDGLFTTGYVKELCTRATSIGADGLIEIRPDNRNLFSMKYYNSNGNTAEMCGNGGRCIAAFAVNLGIAEKEREFFFSSDAGVHKTIVLKDNLVRLWMTDPVIEFLDEKIQLSEGEELTVSSLNTGVPHAVVFTNGITADNFQNESTRLRRHPAFGNAGTNVDYVQIDDRHNMEIRTFERGVEGETLACGTGAVAAAVCGVETLNLHYPVHVKVRSGCILTVGKDDFGYWLEGEARIVYSGILQIP